MIDTTYDKALRVVDKTIESLGSRLSGHGEKVAYVLYQLLKTMGVTDDKELVRMCMSAYMHDIGGYKTEDLNDLISSESSNAHSHAVYSYVFLKYQFTDKEIDLNAIKYHHVPYNAPIAMKSKVSDNANLLCLADRIAILSDTSLDCITKIKERSGTHFNPAHIDIFLQTQQECNILEKLKNKHYKDEIRLYLSQFAMNERQVKRFATIICHAMDFHSNVTNYHSMVVASVAKTLAQCYHAPNIELIEMAAAMHDVGKLKIPISILEKPDRFTDDEFQLMKQHAIASYEILGELGITQIRDIGALHHEKLDGSGYPFGLTAEQIPFETRLVAVADIASALLARRSYKPAMPKNQVIGIMKDMVADNEIDGDIVDMFVANYDHIMEEVKTSIQIRKKSLAQMEESYYKEYSQIIFDLLPRGDYPKKGLVWSESLQTGDGMIDGYHKDIILGLGEFLDCYFNKVGDLSEKIIILGDKINTCFDYEESRMVEANYLAIDNHKSIHDSLRNKLEKIGNRFLEEEISISLFSEIHKIIQLISHHFKGMDKGFVVSLTEEDVIYQ